MTLVFSVLLGALACNLGCRAFFNFHPECIMCLEPALTWVQHQIQKHLSGLLNMFLMLSLMLFYKWHFLL